MESTSEPWEHVKAELKALRVTETDVDRVTQLNNSSITPMACATAVGTTALPALPSSRPSSDPIDLRRITISLVQRRHHAIAYRAAGKSDGKRYLQQADQQLRHRLSLYLQWTGNTGIIYSCRFGIEDGELKIFVHRNQIGGKPVEYLYAPQTI
ncbi:hypothetical protein BD626DRAFT_506127 [Schizophyllum amplum]|uniref:Uncharacterized protein n=1 Tax=Schizophyllum amplum TaxID=97359 RepID=A0A550C5B3_9AGAR|nr:hypothetical protein BD626DRAFT_506127 [Auriculariopsis ampla]